MSHEKPSLADPSPYSPFAAPSVASTPLDAGPFAEHFPLLRTFRRRMLVLGAMWIVLGPLGVVAEYFLGAGLGALDKNTGGFEEDLRFVIEVITLPTAVAAVWMVAGVGTLLKRIEAVWFGLAVNFLTVLGCTIDLKFGMIGLAILITWQAQRVLDSAKRLRAAGVPLDAKA